MNTNTRLDTIRTEKIDTLNDLIQITRDSAKFYGDAAGKVSNGNLKQLFAEMATSKNGLVGAMSREVRAEGESPATSGTVRGALGELYTDVRAQLGDTNYGYVAGLEASEDRLMKAFHAVVKDDDVPSSVRQTVNSYLPTIQKHHDLMRDRKWAMEARA